MERVRARFDGPSTGSGCTEPAAAGVKARFDGFSARKRRRFVATLARTGCWSDAARVAGISRNTAMRWRNKDARFAALCAAAIDKAAGHIETLAWERAVIGIEEPVIHYGKVVGTRIKRSDSIFRMLLMASNKEKYGRMGAVDRKAIERELRAEVEREVRERLLPAGGKRRRSERGAHQGAPGVRGAAGGRRGGPAGRRRGRVGPASDRGRLIRTGRPLACHGTGATLSIASVAPGIWSRGHR